MVNILDQTIAKLKKRNQPAPVVKQPDPILKQGKVMDILWDKVVGFFSDITSVILKGNYDVTVKNFPKTQDVKIANIKDFPTPEKQDYSGIMTSLEALQRTIKDIPVTNIPETQKVIVENQIKPEKIVFPNIQKVEVTNPSKQEKIIFPKQMDVAVTNNKEIIKSIDTMSAQMSQMMKQMAGGKSEVTKEQMSDMFQNMINSLTTAIEQNKVTSVDVNNTGSFPVVFPIPTFKDSNGQNTQGRVDDEGNQITKIKEVSPTDESKLNSSLIITTTNEETATINTMDKTIGSDLYRKTISEDGSVISISAWQKL